MATRTDTDTRDPQLPPPPGGEEYPGGFDYAEFWELHKNRILLGAAAVVAALVVATTVQVVAHQRAAAAARMLSAAKDGAALEQLAKKYPRSMAAANALLLLAADQRGQKDYAAAAATLEEFIARFPKHPLLGGAYLSLGCTLEAQGKPEEALLKYDQAAQFTGTYSASAAPFARAALLAALDRGDAARQTCENLLATAPESTFAREAQRLLQLLQTQP